ncbi:MAG: hypothetical protein ABSB88_26950 [Bryobacteraceae bacterium]|jgi:hypothetical protein
MRTFTLNTQVFCFVIAALVVAASAYGQVYVPTSANSTAMVQRPDGTIAVVSPGFVDIVDPVTQAVVKTISLPAFGNFSYPTCATLDTQGRLITQLGAPPTFPGGQANGLPGAIVVDLLSGMVQETDPGGKFYTIGGCATGSNGKVLMTSDFTSTPAMPKLAWLDTSTLTWTVFGNSYAQGFTSAYNVPGTDQFVLVDTDGVVYLLDATGAVKQLGLPALQEAVDLGSVWRDHSYDRAAGREAGNPRSRWGWSPRQGQAPAAVRPCESPQRRLERFGLHKAQDGQLLRSRGACRICWRRPTSPD